MQATGRQMSCRLNTRQTGTVGTSEKLQGVGKTLFSQGTPVIFHYSRLWACWKGTVLGRLVGGIQQAPGGPPWPGPAGVHPGLVGGCLSLAGRQDGTFLTSWLLSVVCPSVWATGFLQKEELVGPAGQGLGGGPAGILVAQPHLGPTQTQGVLTKGNSTSFGPNPKICLQGPLFIETFSFLWGRSAIHTLSRVYNSIIKFKVGCGFNSE